MKFCLSCNSEYGDERTVCPKDGSELAQKSQDPLLGTVVKGKYKVESLIGKGAMGAVYRVVKEPDGGEFALKVLHSFLGDDNESVIRFHREAKATITLDHPHIVDVRDFGVMPHGQPFLVMELLTGISLERVLGERHRLTVDESLPIVRQVCEALGAAHKQGIVHRDVKPDNIILETKEGRSNYVKVVDFGIAKLAQAEGETPIKLTRTGMICGTPAYISPEQIQAQSVDARSDVYSMGIVIVEMLTGRVPFMAEELVKLLFMHVTEEVPSIASLCPEAVVSPSVQRVIAKSLSKNPAERQQSMSQLWEELDLASRDESYGAGYGAENGAAAVVEPAPVPSARPQAPLPAVSPERVGRDRPSGRQTREIDADEQAITRTHPHLRSTDSMPVAFRSSGAISTVPSSSSSPLWVFVAVAVVLLLMLLMNPWAANRSDPRRLVEQGRTEDALLILDKKKMTGGLSPQERETYDKALVGLAKKKAAVGQYGSAISLLEHIPTGSAQAGEAQRLLRDYRHIHSH